MSSDARSTGRKPLIFSEIEELRRRGLNQSEIAEMHGVSRQAVSWHKKTYGGTLTPRQIVNQVWPWETSGLHGKSKAYQRLRDHGEFMVTCGHGMSDDKMQRLKSWWRMLEKGKSCWSSIRAFLHNPVWGVTAGLLTAKGSSLI